MGRKFLFREIRKIFQQWLIVTDYACVPLYSEHDRKFFTINEAISSPKYELFIPGEFILAKFDDIKFKDWAEIKRISGRQHFETDRRIYFRYLEELKEGWIREATDQEQLMITYGII